MESGKKSEEIDINDNNNITGDCFMSAYRNIFHNRQYKLVHGVVTRKSDGIQHPHAWCEFGGMVYDNSNGNNICMPKELYYSLGNIELTVRYTYDEAVNNVLNTEMYGWWNPLFKPYQELISVKFKKES
jgi:hypothetical protein